MQIKPSFDLETSANTNVNWTLSATNDVILECPTWVFSQKRTARNKQMYRSIHQVDTTALNTEQRIAYDKFNQHYTAYTSAGNPEPLHMLIYGTAGTGKSFFNKSYCSATR